MNRFSYVFLIFSVPHPIQGNGYGLKILSRVYKNRLQQQKASYTYNMTGDLPLKKENSKLFPLKYMYLNEFAL